MTEPDLEALRASLVTQASCTTKCPDADVLMALALGQLKGSERDTIAAQVGACAQCAAAVQMALASGEWAEALAYDLEDEVTKSNVVSITTRARRRMPLWIPAALAAGIALIFVAVPTLRTAPPEPVLRGPALQPVQPADSAVLSAPPTELRWPCEAAPHTTRVELLDAAALRIWQGSTRNCTVALPAQIQASMLDGAYLWRLTSDNGEVVAGPFGFSVEH